MKILFAAHQFFPEHYAGVEIVTLGLAKELRARGHETFVLAPKRTIPGSGIEPGEIEDYDFEGVPVRRIGRPKEGLFRPYRVGYENEVMARRAREYVREVRPDVVHAEHFQGLSASVMPVFKETGAPLVYTATDFWTICPVVDLMRHDGVMCRGPEITHCVRCMVSRQPNSLPGVALKAATKRTPEAVFKAADKLAETPLSAVFPLNQVWALKERPGYIREHVEHIDHIIAYTSLMRDLLRENNVGDGKVGISYYGIDTSRISTTPRNPPPPLRVGFIGTLAPHKGCDILVKAFRSFESEATLQVYANLKRFPSFVEHLLKLAEGDERISFPGPFQREKVGQVLAGLDVLVVPSRWYENQPGVIFEAFAAGIPVVATDLGGNSEFVKHEENGLLFELENDKDLAHQLRRLAEEPGLLDKLRAGIGPVKTVRENVDELEELYAGLIEEKRRKSVRILVTGANGQLGRELADILPERRHEVVALSRTELDVTDPVAVEQALEEHSPELVVNTAAFTNVDGCETEVEAAYAANALGPRNLAQFCERSGLELLHVSTNYVFDGEKEVPFAPFDPPNPISVYGRTKLAGEEYVRNLSTRWYVVRSAGVYGEGHNFARTMLRLAEERDVLKVKDDEYISPTYARDLAEGIAGVAESGLYGLYHVTSSGSCSWYEFAREVFSIAGVGVEVVPVPGSEYPLPAARPANGVLSALGGPRLRHWREALEDYLERERRPSKARNP